MIAERRERVSTSPAGAEPWEDLLNRMVLDAVSETCSEHCRAEVSDDSLTGDHPAQDHLIDDHMMDDRLMEGRKERESRNGEYPLSGTRRPIRDPAEIFLYRAAAFLKSREDGPELLARLRGMLVGDGPDTSPAAQPPARAAAPDTASPDTAPPDTDAGSS